MLLEPPLGLEESVELTTSDERHDEEQSEVRHEQVLHSNQELVLALEHDVLLQLGVLNLVVFNQYILSNDFDGVELLVE